ncbi:MAG: hypothetical protein QM773_07850 [Hyphomonadaceae bacterium]
MRILLFAAVFFCVAAVFGFFSGRTVAHLPEFVLDRVLAESRIVKKPNGYELVFKNSNGNTHVYSVDLKQVHIANADEARQIQSAIDATKEPPKTIKDDPLGAIILAGTVGPTLGVTLKDAKNGKWQDALVYGVASLSGFGLGVGLGYTSEQATAAEQLLKKPEAWILLRNRLFLDKALRGMKLQSSSVGSASSIAAELQADSGLTPVQRAIQRTRAKGDELLLAYTSVLAILNREKVFGGSIQRDKFLAGTAGTLTSADFSALESFYASAYAGAPLTARAADSVGIAWLSSWPTILTVASLCAFLCVVAFLAAKAFPKKSRVVEKREVTDVDEQG